MNNSINRRQAMTGVASAITAGATVVKAAQATQHHANDQKIAEAVSEWFRLEQMYNDYPGDPPEDYQELWCEKQRIAEMAIAKTPAQSWRGVCSKAEFMQNEGNLGFAGGGTIRDVLESFLDDVVRLSV